MDPNALYRGMDRAALDAAYNNVAAVADFGAVLADFRTRSAAFYERHDVRRNLEYGNGERERFDLVRAPGTDAPTVIYLHGGYWQSLTKEDFAFIGEGPLAHRHNVILAEYTLAPEASMTEIVGQIGRLLDLIDSNMNVLAASRGPVTLVGHSAGGHLSLLHRDHPLLSRTLAISPLSDLEPIGLSWLNDKLNLTVDEVDLFSPLRRIGDGPDTTVAVGLKELPELVRQAHDYAIAGITAGQPVHYLAIEGRNHFSILEELASPTGVLTKTLNQSPGPTW